MHNTMTRTAGFTLIEISIVLVIVALIIGGILVGQDLIAAATVRAQISQIEKYRSAVNTFRGKYNDELPGDADSQTASMFGLTPRVTNPNYGSTGLGDNNGILQGFCCGGAAYPGGTLEGGGETLVFWQDLSSAGLIDGTFNSLANMGTEVFPSGTAISQYLPAAKIGNGNYVYVWNGGWGIIAGTAKSDGMNYFGITQIIDIGVTYPWSWINGQAGLTVAQAYAIDTKIDDGLPQYGHVLALFLSAGTNYGPVVWAANKANPNSNNNWGGSAGDSEYPGYTIANAYPVQALDGIRTLPKATTCYDNSNTPGVEHYSMSENNGAGVNCALSFQFQ